MHPVFKKQATKTTVIITTRTVYKRKKKLTFFSVENIDTISHKTNITFNLLCKIIKYHTDLIVSLSLFFVRNT